MGINNPIQQKADDTMRSRLGDAVSLIEDHRFLRMFRRCQIDHEEAFAFSIGLARKKNRPANYFAKMWGPKERSKTVQWITKMLNQQKAKIARMKHAVSQKARQMLKEKHTNVDGIKRVRELKQAHNLLS